MRGYNPDGFDDRSFDVTEDREEGFDTDASNAIARLSSDEYTPFDEMIPISTFEQGWSNTKPDKDEMFLNRFEQGDY